MNKLFKKVAAAVVGMAMAIGVGVAIGHGEVHKASGAVASTPTWSSGAPDFGTSYASGTKELNGINWFVSCAGNTTSIGWNKATQGANNDASSAPLSTISESTKYGMYQTSGGWKVEKIVISISNSLDSVTGSYYIWYSTNNGTSWTQAVKEELTASTTTLTYDHGSNIGDSVRFAFGFGTSVTTKTRINLSNIQVYAEVQAQEITGISVGTLAVHSGESKQAQVTCIPDGSSLPSDVAYASSNPQVFTVNNSGLVTGVAAGTATLTVSSASKSISETSTVTVSDYPLSGIQVGKQYALVGAETKMELTGVEVVNNNPIGVIAEYEEDPSCAHLVTVENGSRTGTVALKINDEYLSWESGNTLSSVDSVSDESSWVVTYENEAYSVINLPTFETGSERYLKLNVQNERFACYLSGQENVLFYEYAEPQPTKTLDHIVLSGTYKTEFYVGEQFSSDGLVVTAHYEEANVEPEVVTEGVTVTPPEMTAGENKVVTVSYGGKEATYTITVLAVVPASMTVQYTGGSIEAGSHLDFTKVAVSIKNNNGTNYAHQDSELEYHLGTIDGDLVTSETTFDKVETVTIVVALTANKEVKATFQFDVVEHIVPATSVTLNKQALELVVGGEKGSLIATVAPQDTTDTLIWSVEPAEGVVSIADDPTQANAIEVTAIAAGTATIKAKAGEKEATCAVTVTAPQPAKYVVSFNANGGSKTMENAEATEGVKYVLPACGFDAPEGQEFAGWKVNGQGDLLQPGAEIDVTAAIELVAQWKDKAPDLGEYLILDGEVMDYPNVSNGTTEVTQQTVSGVGFVSGPGSRRYDIGTVTNAFNNHDFIMLYPNAYIYNSTVLPAIKKIELATNGVFGTYGPSTQVKVAVAFGSEPLTSALTDSGVTLDDIDTVFTFTPKESGMTYFRIQTMNDKKAQIQIKIYFGNEAEPPVQPTGISLDKTTGEVKVGSTLKLNASLAPSGAQGTITWESNHPEIASVADGTVTGVKAGEATITAKCGELHAECVVTVTENVTPTPTNDGSQEHPYTVSEALAIAQSLADGATTENDVYVKGIIEGEPQASSKTEGAYKFNIVDKAGNEEQLVVYFANCNVAPKAGDEVLIFGKIMNYVSKSGTHTYEIAEGATATIKGESGDGDVTPPDEGGDTPTPTPTPSGKTLVAIEITAPSKLEYFIGDEALDLTGLEVKAVYSDGTKEVVDLSKVNVSAAEFKKAGSQTITVSFNGQSGTFTIHITHNLDIHDGCHASILASSALISITTLIGAGLLMLRKRKEQE